MPRALTDAKKAEIDDLFDLYDTNKNGTIDVAELGTLLRALGLSPSNAQVRKCMSKYDKDKSKDLTKAEFTELYQDESLPEADTDADLKKAFAAFDVDGSGFVSRKELTEALTSMGEPMSKDEVDYMFKSVDGNNDGKLNFDEFVCVMVGAKPKKASSEEPGKQAPAPAAASSSTSGPKKSELWADLKKRLPSTKKGAEGRKERFELFSQFDPNGNGYLSLAEVDAGCRKILKLDELTDDLAPILMRAFTAAKDARKRGGKRKKQADDYVEKAEFRLLFVYIRAYFELWVMFDTVDTGDDRRVDFAEFQKAVPTIESWGVKIDDAKAEFDSIDKNGGGQILFQEFAEWATKKNLDLKEDGDSDDDDEKPPTQEEKEEEKKEAAAEAAAKPAEEEKKTEEPKAEPKQSKSDLWKELKEKLPSTKKGAEGLKERMALFSQFDPNGNGYLSLAEVDAGCRKILKLDELTNDLAPILMRAFTSAKDVHQRAGKKKKHDDDYIEKSEFRLLFVYIRAYFELWVMFDAVDTGDDRRVDFSEFQKAVPTIESWGVKIDDAKAEFDSIDKNGGGQILFQEFAEWATKKNLDLKEDGDSDDDDEKPPTQEEKEEEKKEAAAAAATEEAAKPAEEEKKPEEAPAKKDRNSIWSELKVKIPWQRTAEQKAQRADLFKQFDPNGNGYLSLAEVDAGCRKILKLDELTNDLAPILMRAFTATKDVRQRAGKKKKNDDDYVERAEFRLLFAAIRTYFELWVMFDTVDTGDDRRVDFGEFQKAVPTIESWGVKIDDAKAEFDSIDKNGGGQILFQEFAEWATKKNLDLPDDGEDTDTE